MDLKINGLDDLQRIGREHPKAAARALNNTMRHVRTQMVKDAGTRYNMKAADMKASMRDTSKATLKRLLAAFSVKGKRAALAKFVTGSLIQRSLAMKGKKIKARPLIKAKIERGKITSYPHAFAAKMKSGHIGIYWRKGTQSLPLKEVTGPSMPQVFSGTWSRLVGVKEKLEANLKHAIEWLMKSGGK